LQINIFRHVKLSFVYVAIDFPAYAKNVCLLKHVFFYCLMTVTYYDDATVCGLVWTKNFVAYRCRTCGISPCMSLCSDCFHAGDHSGHDFNMFRSGAGGACDCGDSTVMNPIGYKICCIIYRD